MEDIDKWKKKKEKININKPKTSEASQFHHPPQEASCIAHQLPKKSDNKLIKNIKKQKKSFVIKINETLKIRFFLKKIGTTRKNIFKRNNALK